MLDWLATLWPVIDREWDGMRRHEGTLSEAIARTARIDTTAGKLAFTVALAAGSYALHRHIVGWRFGC